MRGRDLRYDAVVDEPVEDYLFIAWPADPLPHLIIRATDRCGYGMRLSSLTMGAATGATRRPEDHRSRRQRERAESERRNIMRLRGRA